MTDPNATAKSTVSLNSVNLERLNQRNADRLVKLENAEGNLNDSGFQLTMQSMTSAKKQRINDSPQLPRAMNRDALQPPTLGSQFNNPASVLNVESPHQKPISELEELDDMLANILRDKAK